MREAKRITGNTVRSGLSEFTVGKYGVALVIALRGYFHGNNKLRWYHGTIVLCFLAGDDFYLYPEIIKTFLAFRNCISDKESTV